MESMDTPCLMSPGLRNTLKPGDRTDLRHFRSKSQSPMKGKFEFSSNNENHNSSSEIDGLQDTFESKSNYTFLKHRRPAKSTSSRKNPSTKSNAIKKPELSLSIKICVDIILVMCLTGIIMLFWNALTKK